MSDAPGQSIWLRPQHTGRGPAPEYTRGQIAAAGVAIADADGLPGVTMRAVAAALNTGPASLYRYVATRDELVELMTNEVNAEFTYADLGTGRWLTDLLTLARQCRRIYLRHPWLLDAAAASPSIGPNAADYLEHALAALADLDVDPRTKLEAIGVFNGVVALLTRMEVTERPAGRPFAQWQQAQAASLSQLLTERHPHLAAALAAPPAEARAPTGQQPAEPLFDRVLTRVLTGLLQPDDTR